MSRETANAARFAKGLCVLSDLEGSLLEALENLVSHCGKFTAADMPDLVYIPATAAIRQAHGNP